MFNDQQQAHGQDFSSAAPEPRGARVLSIEELRQKLGLPLASERREEASMPTEYERPRIVRRRKGAAVLAVAG